MWKTHNVTVNKILLEINLYDNKIVHFSHCANETILTPMYDKKKLMHSWQLWYPWNSKSLLNMRRDEELVPGLSSEIKCKNHPNQKCILTHLILPFFMDLIPCYHYEYVIQCLKSRESRFVCRTLQILTMG